MRKLARVIRAVVLNLIAVIGALVLLLVVLFGVAQTKYGERFLRRQVVAAVNSSIAGSVGIAGLTFQGNRLVLDGISIWTPERELVGRIHRVSATLGLSALVHRTIHVESFGIVQPELFLRRDERGLNLARALRSTKPPSRKPLALRIALDRMALDGGTVDYRAAAGNHPPHARVAGLTVRAHANLDARSKRGDGAVQVNGVVRAPLSLPLQVVASGRMLGDEGSGKLVATAGPSVVEAQASAEGKEMRARLSRLEVAPMLMRAFVPGYASSSPVKATASVAMVGKRMAGRASLSAGPGTMELQGQADRSLPSFAVKAAGRHLDLASLLPRRPRSDIAFTLDAAGSGRGWAALDGHLDLDMPAARVGSETLGPVNVHARSQRDGARSLEALAKLPGLHADARGAGDVQSVQGRSDVAVLDAGRLLRVAGMLLGRPLPPASGALAVTVTADGRPGALRTARLDASARTLTIGTTEIRGLAVTADSDAGALRSRVSLKGPLPMLVTMAGQWLGGGHRRLELQRMRVSYPQATWSLAGPALIAVGDNRVQVKGFKLRAAQGQQIAVDMLKRGRFIDGDVAVSALQLASLPVPAGKLPLAGILDVTLRAQGSTSAPVADAQMKLRQARVAAYKGVDASLVAHVEDRRARGTFEARSADGWARGRFALPASWPPPADAELSVDATARLPELSRLPMLVTARQPLAGAVQTLLTVRGTVAAPRVELTVNADDLTAVVPRGTVAAPAVDLRLRATYAGDRGTMRLRGRSSNGGELSARARVRARVSLVKPAAAVQAIRRAPMSARLVANDFDMSPLSTASNRVAAVGGRLGGEVRVDGTVAQPAVKGRLSWRNGRVVLRRK